jgi:hypothetical protein
VVNQLPREIRVYFEGDTRLRRGFHAFLLETVEAARSARLRIQFIATGGTPAQDFRDALDSHPDAVSILLLDSEGPFHPHSERALSVGFAPADRVFWMVQMMESWFLADPEALANYYKTGFLTSALPGNSDIESLPKTRVEECLKKATRKTQKRVYDKANHAPDILALIKSARVRSASRHCDRLFIELERLFR